MKHYQQLVLYLINDLQPQKPWKKKEEKKEGEKREHYQNFVLYRINDLHLH
jgi:hypothetical protein